MLGCLYPGGVRGWLLFPKHLGFKSAKYCCYYRDTKITDLIKFVGAFLTKGVIVRRGLAIFICVQFPALGSWRLWAPKDR